MRRRAQCRRGRRPARRRPPLAAPARRGPGRVRIEEVACVEDTGSELLRSPTGTARTAGTGPRPRRQNGGRTGRWIRRSTGNRNPSAG